MKYSFDQSVIVALLMAFLLTSLACLSLMGIGNLVEKAHWVEHTQVVIDRLQTLLTDVEEESIAMRSFLLTGNPAYLQSFQKIRQDVPAQLLALKELTSDNPARQSDLAQLQEPLNQYMAFIERLGQSGGNVQPPSIARQIDESNQLIGRIKDRITAMQAGERLLLQQRAANAQRSSTVLKSIIVTGALIGLMVLLGNTLSLRREITTRQRTQRELDRFFNLTSDLFCIAGFDGYFKRLNPAWEKTFGYTGKDLLSKPFVEFLHPDDVEKTRREFARQRHGQEAINFENRYRCKDGSYRWLLWSAQPLVDEQMIFASARDITARKEADERIQKLNKELQQRADLLEAANKELEAFSYSVSHDLRAPLRHIHGFVELLQKSPALQGDEPSRRHMNVISKAAKEMGLLIDDLLAFSRTGRAEMHPIEIDMRELVDQVIRDLEMACRERKVAWEIRPLPGVTGDPSLLRLVWTNLLDNALKYTRPRHEAKIEIGQIVRDSPEAGGREVVFYVRDNGVGFDMRYSSKLFGVFQRLHRTEDFEGTGIGLANVQRIIHRHGGRVWAEGQVDSGATFYFSLPATATPPVQAP